MKRTASGVVLILVAGLASAHHGAQSQFDQSKSLEVAGVVTKIRFVNPHSYVYFDVTNEDGSVDNWRCEMRAATVLKRSGWSADMFAPGTAIRIEGVPARNEPHGCYVNEIVFDNGEHIQRYQQLTDADDAPDISGRPARLPSGEPNIAGDWAAPQRLLTEEEVRNRRPPDFRRMRYQQSPAGIEASAGFDMARDNPRFHCQATNIFQDWTFDQHINRITQEQDTITLQYGFMDIVRTIHMNMNEHPKDLQPSISGHSIGKWEGDTLVVDTVGFLPGYLDGRGGVMYSDRMHVIERFTLDTEEGSLSRKYVAEDPLYLTARVEGQDKLFISETPFDPYNCEDLTNEVAGGF